MRMQHFSRSLMTGLFCVALAFSICVGCNKDDSETSQNPTNGAQLLYWK